MVSPMPTGSVCICAQKRRSVCVGVCVCMSACMWRTCLNVCGACLCSLLSCVLHVSQDPDELSNFVHFCACCQSKHRLGMSSDDSDSSSCDSSWRPVDRVEVWRVFSTGLTTPYAFEGESRLVSRLVIFTRPREYGRFIVASRGVLHLQRLVFYHHALVARGEPGLFVHDA